MSSSAVRPRAASANIFINYRREDSSGHAGRLFDALSSQFAGRLFMDIDTLEPGVDFVDAIEQAVGSCEVLIVVIGREWLTIKNAAGHRRLDDAADYVRLEVESALARKIRVIPVLVQDAPMPRAEELPPSLARLARRNAIELSDARWAYDVDRLARTIQDILKEKEASAPAAVPAPEMAVQPPAPVAPAVAAKGSGSRVWLLSIAAAVLVAAAVLASVLWIRRTPSGSGAPSPVQQVKLEGVVGVAVPAGAAPAGSPPSAAPTPNPATDATPNGAPSAGKSATAADRASEEPSRDPKRVPPISEPSRKAPSAAAPSDHEPSREPAKVHPVSEPNRKAPSATIAFDEEPSEPVKNPAAHPPAANLSSAASLEPPRATITAPRSEDKVGASVEVQGTVLGYDPDHHQIFLCIRQGNGSLYPRGELFPKDGQWSIQLRSSKEKTFEILVVSASSKEAAQVLRDQKSRDDGIRILPAGTSISSGAVALKREAWLKALLKPKSRT